MHIYEINAHIHIQSSINKSTKAVIGRNLTTISRNHLFVYLFI